MTCRTTHHHACREHLVAVLNKAALDAAFELKAISNIIDCVAHDEKLKIEDLVSRLYAASEALGPVIPIEVADAMFARDGELVAKDNFSLRPEVFAFAVLMERRMRDHDEDKGSSWKGMPAASISVSVCSKALLLEHSINCGATDGAIRHAVDAANFCLMTADVLGGVKP